MKRKAPEAPLTDFERQRQQTIPNNRKRLAELSVDDIVTEIGKWKRQRLSLTHRKPKPVVSIPSDRQAKAAE